LTISNSLNAQLVIYITLAIVLAVTAIELYVGFERMPEFDWNQFQNEASGYYQKHYEQFSHLCYESFQTWLAVARSKTPEWMAAVLGRIQHIVILVIDLGSEVTKVATAFVASKIKGVDGD
jgi:hypothetical protein